MLHFKFIFKNPETNGSKSVWQNFSTASCKLGSFSSNTELFLTQYTCPFLFDWNRQARKQPNYTPADHTIISLATLCSPNTARSAANTSTYKIDSSGDRGSSGGKAA